MAFDREGEGGGRDSPVRALVKSHSFPRSARGRLTMPIQDACPQKDGSFAVSRRILTGHSLLLVFCARFSLSFSYLCFFCSISVSLSDFSRLFSFHLFSSSLISQLLSLFCFFSSLLPLYLPLLSTSVFSLHRILKIIRQLDQSNSLDLTEQMHRCHAQRCFQTARELAL